MPTLYRIAPGTFQADLIEASADAWTAYTRHPFVERLGAGDLPEAAFKAYLVQDYLFLLHFGRSWALAAAKADNFEDVRACAATLDALVNEEVRLHVRYCEGFGIDEATMAASDEHPANMAYTRFVVAKGLEGDLLDLLVALAPCVVGYGEIGARLKAGGVDPANPYADWIETYAGDDFAAVVRGVGEQLARAAARRLGPIPARDHPRWPALKATFAAGCRLEAAFWQMGLDAG